VLDGCGRATATVFDVVRSLSPEPDDGPAGGSARNGERLTRARVVEAATAIARRDGVDAVSMRRLAAELGVSTMAAYRHVPGKDELVDDVVDAVIATIPLDVDGDGDWQERIEELMLSSFRILSAFPGLIEHLRGRALQRPGIVGWLEALSELLIASGAPLVERSAASTGLFWLLRGALSAQVEWDEVVASMEEVRRADDEDRIDAPNIRRGPEVLAERDVEDFLVRSVRALLGGIAVSVAR